MAITVQSVITRARGFLGDDMAGQGGVTGVRWSDPVLLAFCDEAMRELAKRLRASLLDATGTTEGTLPAAPIELADDLPFEAQWRGVVADYVVAQAFGQDGADLENLKRAKWHMDRFEAAAGAAHG